MRYYWGLGIGHKYSHGLDIRSQQSAETPTNPMPDGGEAEDSTPAGGSPTLDKDAARSHMNDSDYESQDFETLPNPMPNDEEAEDAIPANSPTTRDKDAAEREMAHDSDGETQDSDSESQDTIDFDGTDLDSDLDSNDRSSSDEDLDKEHDLEQYDTYEADSD